MSNTITLTSVRIAKPTLDIRNTKGVIHTKPKQLLWSSDWPAGKAEDDVGSLYPASNELDNWVTLLVEFAVPAPALDLEDSDYSLTLSDAAGVY